MRDKNLKPKEFNIQLEKYIERKLFNEKFLRTSVSASPKCLTDNQKFSVNYPRDFKSLRSLAIIQWYFPEELHWRILMDLKEMTFSQLNEKQKIEIFIYLSSKEIMEIYLFETKRYTSRELFGNILGNELSTLLRQFRIKVVKPRKPKRIERHRGYRDKGSLKPTHRWLPDYDFTLTEYQTNLERKQDLTLKISLSLEKYLRELRLPTDLE